MEKFFFEDEYKKLNDNQKKAVDSIYWPVMVIAWPGSGKTQIIALRTANIILQTWINPENILITTFTEAWVVAIKKRLVSFIWTSAYKVKITTFHSFCDEIISDFPENFIEEKAKSIIDEIESYEILSNILDEYIKKEEINELFSPQDRYMYLRDIKDRIGKLKTEWVSTKDFREIILKQQEIYDEKISALNENKRIRDLGKRMKKDKETYDKHINKLKELALIYEKYQEKIRDIWLYDYADMINFVTDKFEKKSDMLAYYAEKFQFIMVDEFQDTNNSQNNIINLILSYFPEEQNIMVVWDDDQSIYRFQWANIENILNFSKIYPKRHTVILDQNYRSSQSILDISQILIGKNSQRISNNYENIIKDLKAVWESKSLDNNWFFILENEFLEKNFVYEQIVKKDINKESFAVIVKTNKQVEEWTDFFQRKGLVVDSKNSIDILKNIYCDFFIKFLKLIENPYFDDSHLIDLLRSDIVDVENIDVIHITRTLYQRNYSKKKFRLWVWDIIRDIENDSFLTESCKNIEKIVNFREMILSLVSNTPNLSINSLIRDIINKLNIFWYIEENWNFNDIQNFFTLVNKIKRYIENNKEITLKNIINKFDLHKKHLVSISRENVKTIESNIVILTAHGSKWLEYDYVFIPQVYEWNWNKKKIADKLKLPVWLIWSWIQYSWLSEKEYLSLEKNISSEEERRLFFVAITRAKKSVIFTMSESKDNKILLQSAFMVETGISPQMYKTEAWEEDLKNMIKDCIIGREDLISTKKDELKYIKDFLSTYKLSPTDLNKFLSDPKVFLKEVIFKYPFLNNENLIFGSAYHKVLEVSVNGKKDWNIFSIEKIKKLFLDEINKYSLNFEEYSRLLERWNKGFEWYYDIFIKNKREILKTEYSFYPKNVLFEWVPLSWKIDKIEIISDFLDNSSSEEISPLWQQALFKNKVSLVDYKTWKTKTIWSIKWLDRNWNKKEEGWDYYKQLLFYKLMFENCSELKSRYDIWELGIDFVEWKDWEYKYISVPYSNEDFEDFKKLVKDSRAKISDIDFWKWELNII